MEIKFINGISVKDTAYGLLVRQYENAYIARRWRVTNNLRELIQTSVNSKLYWMLRDGHPQVHSLWPSTKGRAYLAFSPTRDKHWAVAIDTVNPDGSNYGKAVFNGKYHEQFKKNKIEFSFEKRNTSAGHMEVARHKVLETIRKMSNFDHSVLYKNKSSEPINGFSTEYDIQRSLLLYWAKTPFAKDFTIIGDEVPINLAPRNSARTNLGRIDILAKHKKRDEYLIIEIKRAKATEEALKQISGYLSALKKREDMSLALLKGCLIAERIPKNIVSFAGQLGFTSYEIMYPIKLTKV